MLTSLAIIASFTCGAIFGAVGVVLLAKRAAVQACVPDKSITVPDGAVSLTLDFGPRPGAGGRRFEPDYYKYLQSRGRIDDPHAHPHGDC